MRKESQIHEGQGEESERQAEDRPMSAFRILQQRGRRGDPAASKRPLLPVAALVLSVLALTAGPAIAAAPSVGWSIHSLAEPTNFNPNDTADRYALAVVNIGNRSSVGAITIADKLPPGLVPVKMQVEAPLAKDKNRGECSLAEVKCTYGEHEEPAVAPGRELVVEISVAVMLPELPGQLVNEATVSGGGGSEAATNASNHWDAGPAQFGIAGFAFAADGMDGARDAQAGDHPYSVTTTIDLNTVLVNSSEGIRLNAAQEAKDIGVDLPLGFVGDPLAAEQCPEIDLTESEGTPSEGRFHALCPAGSQVGSVRFVWSGGFHVDEAFPVYNMVPERGYPAELGFNAAGLAFPIFLYANVLRSASGYRLQVATPGALRSGDDAESIQLTVFGDPGEVNGTGRSAAFLTNPTRCLTEPTKVSAYVTSWEGGSAGKEETAYPEVTGCNLLQGAAAFDPSIAVTPETTQADTPSGYEIDLKLPQDANVFGALATPELKKATVTLPPGVSISPSAASGPDALAGCPATGPGGINIGSNDVEPDGEDKGDPEATELGEGHPGGDGSPYDDGLWHAAPGHCPESSRIGEVEVKTPLLEEPLRGHVYLAESQCGGTGQPECTEAAAEEGKVFGLYLEVAGSGVIVKLAGTVEAGGYGAHSLATGLAPGQLRTRFEENPQLPFEELKLTLTGGQRAALANPQACGTATTTSKLEPWSALASGPSSSFGVSGCASPMPFAPGFQAGTVTPLAGGYSPFTLQLTRQDSEQDLAGLQATLPEGLVAKLAGAPLCGEAQANAGTCSQASQIGTISVTAGAGSEPLQEAGKVYLTGPYNNGPFGVSVVVPAVAGPFNLGYVVVRGSIRLDPRTAQATVVSNSFPAIIDGVPLRVRAVDVTLTREAFTLNPTNCYSQHVTATLTAEQGASATVSSPFAVTGCATLPFAPSFTASTSAKTSREDGASLTVKVTYPSGSLGNQANIKSAKVVLPASLPARLSTLREACTAEQFASNPAGCPPESIVGHAIVHTQLLPVPLTGPAYFVSHGNEAFPNLVMVLQGDGVTIDLVGDTDIKNDMTSSTFASTPDVPIETFELTLPEGKYSALSANGNLCQQKLVMPTAFVGQNGATLNQDTHMEVSGCAPAIHVAGHRVKGRTATIRVSVPGAGKLTATGKGLSKATAEAKRASTLTLKLTLSNAEVAILKKHKGRKLAANVKLTFSPKQGGKLNTSVTVLIG
jgi:hypothetical protein